MGKVANAHPPLILEQRTIAFANAVAKACASDPSTIIHAALVMFSHAMMEAKDDDERESLILAGWST
jgi:hypothetical protein